LRDVLALEPLHRDVRVALVELAERNDANDAGMAQAGEHAPLATEARLLARIDARDRDDLQRDRRAGHLVASAIDDADTAAAHFAFDHEAAREERLFERGRRHVFESIETRPDTHPSTR